MTSADAFRRAAMPHMSSPMVATGSWGERDQGAIMSIVRRGEKASEDGASIKCNSLACPLHSYCEGQGNSHLGVSRRCVAHSDEDAWPLRIPHQRPEPLISASPSRRGPGGCLLAYVHRLRHRHRHRHRTILYLCVFPHDVKLVLGSGALHHVDEASHLKGGGGSSILGQM